MLIEHHPDTFDEPAGQATFDMANLRPQLTGLPFVVFISQRDGARHDVRVKVALSPKVIASQMGSYALRPFRFEGGSKLDGWQEALLERWVILNMDMLVAYWDAAIAYTEDAIAAVKSIG